MQKRSSLARLLRPLELGHLRLDPLLHRGVQLGPVPQGKEQLKPDKQRGGQQRLRVTVVVVRDSWWMVLSRGSAVEQPPHTTLHPQQQNGQARPRNACNKARTCARLSSSAGFRPSNTACPGWICMYQLSSCTPPAHQAAFATCGRYVGLQHVGVGACHAEAAVLPNCSYTPTHSSTPLRAGALSSRWLEKPSP